MIDAAFPVQAIDCWATTFHMLSFHEDVATERLCFDTQLALYQALPDGAPAFIVAFLFICLKQFHLFKQFSHGIGFILSAP